MINSYFSSEDFKPKRLIYMAPGSGPKAADAFFNKKGEAKADPKTATKTAMKKAMKKAMTN